MRKVMVCTYAGNFSFQHLLPQGGILFVELPPYPAGEQGEGTYEPVLQELAQEFF